MEEPELLQRELARERAARKQAEQLLEQKSLELYHRNRELEIEVFERRRIEASLREYGAALTRSNAELEQFAYIASHDLQAPLRGIIGFSQLLTRRLNQQLGDTLDADCREYLQFIEGSAHNLRAIIRDLLEFSRAGRSSGTPQPLSLQVPLMRALAELEPVLRSTGAKVEYGALPMVVGEETQLAQLLRNLVDNGIKYVATGVPPRIRIDCERLGQEMRIAVADNGIGVPAEHRERIFQIFQRLHEAEDYPGTGVGLAICKKVVERLGGRLWVECPPEGGSVFFFTLPAPG
ncbi:MAG: ATP-binding protein [Pseudomonadota bacterium]